MKKMSYCDAVTYAKMVMIGQALPEGMTADVVVQRLDELAASLKKKNSGERKKTPAQEQNDAMREQVVNILSDGVMRNVADLRDALGLPSDTTPQRITGILRPLLESGRIVGKDVKRKRFYTLPEFAETATAEN